MAPATSVASYPRFRAGPKNRWELRALAGQNDDGSSHFIYGSYYGGARGAKEAQADLVRKAKALRGVAEPLKPTTPKAAFERTFEDAAEAWFSWKTPKMEPNGRDNVRQILDDYLLPELGPIQLWRFRGELALEPGDEPDPLLVDLSDFFSEMKGKRGGPLAPATIVQGPARVTKAVFRYAVTRNWLSAKRPVVRRPPPRRHPALQRRRAGGRHRREAR